MSHGDITAGEEDRGSTIGDLAGVAGCGGTALLERWFELAEAFEGRSFPDAIIFVYSDLRLIAVLVLHNGRVGSDLGLQETGGLSSGGLLVAADG